MIGTLRSEDTWDKMIHEMSATTFIIYRLRHTSVCNFDNDQARTIVWPMMKSRIGHPLRISLSEREGSSVYGNVIRYSFTTDSIIDEDQRIHWSYQDLCRIISDDSIWICSMCSFSTLESSFDFSVVCVALKIHVSSVFHLRNVRHR